ncbi:MAG: Xaa-Pro peptidase family protein [Elusimicrobiota bacterium]
MNLRIKNLQEKIAKELLDGFVSFNPSNILYLTGIRLENSFVFVSRKDIILVVSKLNYPSAEKYANCPPWRIQIASDKFFRRYKNKKIGFDNSISVARLEKLEKIKGVKFFATGEPTWKSCSNFIEGIRQIKDQSEIKKIKTACKISQKAITYTSKKLKAGITEKELADELEYFLRKSGAEKSAFDIIVASGENTANPHHKPTNRKIQKDDVVLVDLGCIYENYNSDLTRTFFLGKISRYAENVFEIVKESQKKAISVIKDGASCKKVDFAARNFIDKNSFGKYFIHGTGHGVGIDIHEEPSIFAKSEMVLKAGMIVTVEPGIYIPNRFGIRIEDTVLVTKTGYEVLTR